MRIAIISPLAADAAESGQQAADLRTASRVAYALSRQLQSRGHQTTLIEVGEDGPDADLALANVVEHVDDFDVVHTFAGHRSLSHVGTMRTVVVASVSREMIAWAPAIYRHFHDRVHFVAAAPTDAADGLRLASVIPWGSGEDSVPEMVASFEELYTKLLSRAARIDRRPWGYYEVLADEPDHKVKRIVVYPGKRLSLQKHRRRTEHWFVLTGEALVTRDEEMIRVTAGHAIDIPVGAWHRVQNPATTDMAFIEVQTGDYFGEDDIERQEDDFGRV